MTAIDMAGADDPLRLESERALALITTSLIFVPSMVFALVDRAVVSDPMRLYLLYAVRVSQLLLYAGGLVGLRRARSRERLRQVIFALTIGVVLTVVPIGWLRPADNWMPVRTYIVASIGLYVGYPNRLSYQLGAWLLLTAGLVATLVGHYTTMPGSERFSVLSNYLLAGMLGLVIGQSRRNLEREFDTSLERERDAVLERERADAELRTLAAIIPICSYCHQVRTEAGAWEMLEAYVRARTDAEFSRVVCPKCAAMRGPFAPHA